MVKLIDPYIHGKKDKKDPINRASQYFQRLKSYNKVQKLDGSNQLTLVLDLDETLVYCTHKKFDNYEKEIIV